MKKRAIKINQNTLKKMIVESVNRVLNEEYDWNHYNSGPSQEEETFQDELYSVIEEYGLNIVRAYGKQDFIKWCVEIINNALNANKSKMKPGKESINKVIRETIGKNFDDGMESYNDNYDDNMDDGYSDMATTDNDFEDMSAGEKMFTVKFNGQPYWTKVPESYIKDRGIKFFHKIADERIGPGTKVEIVPEKITQLNEAQLKRIIKESVSRALKEEFYGYKENGEFESHEDAHGRLDQALSELMQEYGFTGQEISDMLARHSAYNSKLQVVRDAIAEKLGGDREDAMKEATKIVLAWKRDFKDENARAQAGSVWHRQKEYGTNWLNSSPDDIE